MFGRKTVGVGIAVVVLFVFGVSRIYAQSGLTLEGLSSRITTLTRRVSTLSNTKASKNEVAALENRVATLEARLEDSTPVSATSRRRPTSTPIPNNVVIATPTRGRPTSTPTPATAVVTVLSQLTIRSGPSNRFEVVGVAAEDDELTITGKNVSGTWWRVDYKGASAWVYGPSYTNNEINVVSTPVWPTITPRPTNTATLRPTVTPRPTRTPTRVRPTPTPRPPTSTPTRVRPTATSTPAQPFIRIASRNMNVRSGPGVNYTVIGYATSGQEFDITGKNADGTWWRIDFEGENAWIYAPYVTDFYADRIRPVPTPVPPMPTPDPTPVPQTETEYSSIEYATILVGMDRLRDDLQRDWNNKSQSERDVIIVSTAAYLELTAEYCNMTLQSAGRMINEHGQFLDDRGFTTRNDIRARAFLMLVLVERREASRSPSGCNDWLSRATRNLLASE